MKKAKVEVIGVCFGAGYPQWNYKVTTLDGQMTDFVWQSDLRLENEQIIDTPDEAWRIT